MALVQKPLIFISHIHEEGELAKLIKDAIVAEFGGFVEVFVSSDNDGIANGAGIAAGAHFVEAVEDGLVRCIAALYLISPKSVRRPWVNFELGAVWCRGAVSKAAGGDRVLAVPICHSGATPGTLPAPLNALNAINAHDAAKLEFTFKSLQIALGVAGAALRTDFNNLAQQVIALELKYSLGDVLGRNFRKTLQRAGDIETMIESCKALAAQGAPMNLRVTDVPQDALDLWNESLNGSLAGKVTMDIQESSQNFGSKGMKDFYKIVFTFDPKLVVDNAAAILATK